MFGNNPIRPPVKGDGAQLDVQQIFPTLQGEGPFSGMPSVFVRLGGCNLACVFCDTEFETFSGKSVDSIVSEVNALAGKARLVVITGGEPFRQPITPLCEALVAEGYKVQIETNGTIYRPVPDAVSIVCSPKNPSGNGYLPIRDDLLKRLDAVKFIVSAHLPAYKDVADVGQGVYGTPVYVQPMDEYDEEKNARNTQLAIELAMRHGYRFSLQLHKVIGVE